MEDASCHSGSSQRALETRKTLWGITAAEYLNLVFPESFKVFTSVLSSRFRRRGQGQLPPPTWLRGLAAAHSENGRRFACRSQHEQRLTYTPWRADGAQRCFQVPDLGLCWRMSRGRTPCHVSLLSQTASHRGRELSGPW